MARVHRYLDGQTGELTVVPFTAAEEAKADQHDADMAQREANRKPVITVESLDARLKVLENK